tara:strand:+ start:1247 stop:1459 length:213 start_codon:yes stop_codon:yes gene_type:complete
MYKIPTTYWKSANPRLSNPVSAGNYFGAQITIDSLKHMSALSLRNIAKSLKLNRKEAKQLLGKDVVNLEN